SPGLHPHINRAEPASTYRTPVKTPPTFGEFRVYTLTAKIRRGGNMKRDVIVGSTFAAVLGLLGAGAAVLKRHVVHAATVMAPRFEVDPMGPKPLPNHWLLGQTIGVAVDAADHIWIIHRAGSLEPGEQHLTSKQAQCCVAAPVRTHARHVSCSRELGT